MFSLKTYNSFGIDAKCKEFIAIDDVASLRECDFSAKHLILGGGSNMLIANDLDYPVYNIGLKGIDIQDQSDAEVIVEVAAGENWHTFVMWSIDQEYGGLENMSLIPGSVGAAPIQNIGAYGVELKDAIEGVHTFDKRANEFRYFEAHECDFAYRDSVFKSREKGRYIITKCRFRLTKSGHNLRLDYGAIREELAKKEINTPTPKDIANAVIGIRESKLPDPKELGNSGSFFKNPIVDSTVIEDIRNRYSDLRFFEMSDNQYKIPATWLIEKCGWKGKRIGDVGVYTKHALVLVNYGRGTGPQLMQLATDIISSVKHEFGINLTPEVNIIT